MPVGPPPHTTKLSNRWRSSGVVVGRLAISKLSKGNKNHLTKEWTLQIESRTHPLCAAGWLAHRQWFSIEESVAGPEHHVYWKWIQQQSPIYRI